MSEKKHAPDAFLKDAEKRIKEGLPKGEVAYATADGQVFSRGSEKERESYARKHAFNFNPPLEIRKVEGEVSEKKSDTKKK